MTLGQLRVLMVLDKNKGASIREIAEALGHASTSTYSVRKQLAALLKGGYIWKVARHSRMMGLTEKARKLLTGSRLSQTLED